MATSLMPWSEKALALLRRMNNFHLPGSSLVRCRRFVVEGEQVGWVPPGVASRLACFPEVFTSAEAGAVALCPALDSYQKRSEAVDGVLRRLKDEDAFSCLRGWRDEVRPGRGVAAGHSGSAAPLNLLSFSFFLCAPDVRSDAALLRQVAHVHGASRHQSVWSEAVRDPCEWLQAGGGRCAHDVAVTAVPHQADVPWQTGQLVDKRIFSGIWCTHVEDHALHWKHLHDLCMKVAGGLAAGTSLRETLIKECEEEACIPACIAETACPVGTVSYTYEDEDGVFPESQFVFDLKLPLEFRPQIGDGEVQDFYLWPLDQVKELLVSEDFKPNSAMVVLDFLIRHSYIHPDAEPYYQEFVSGLHKSL